MSFDKVVDSVEDIKKKFAAKVRLPQSTCFPAPGLEVVPA